VIPENEPQPEHLLPPLAGRWKHLADALLETVEGGLIRIVPQETQEIPANSDFMDAAGIEPANLPARY
jgi:hypothetical protein